MNDLDLAAILHVVGNWESFFKCCCCSDKVQKRAKRKMFPQTFFLQRFVYMSEFCWLRITRRFVMLLEHCVNIQDFVDTNVNVTLNVGGNVTFFNVERPLRWWQTNALRDFADWQFLMHSICDNFIKTEERIFKTEWDYDIETDNPRTNRIKTDNTMDNPRTGWWYVVSCSVLTVGRQCVR